MPEAAQSDSELTEADVNYYRDTLESALGIPFVTGNRVQVLQNGDEIFPAMLAAIDAATESIDFVTYVYWQGEIARRFALALARRSAAGCTVRVVLDAFGSKRIDNGLVDEMEQAGVELRWFRPLVNLRLWRLDKRTHRKVLVVDRRVGFTGGVGIAEEWTGNARDSSEWRDTHFRLEGPAVRSLTAAFRDNWNEAGEWTWDSARAAPAPPSDEGVPMQVVRASSTVGWSDTASLLRSLVALSRNRVQIATPYFVPDSCLVGLLRSAVRRGVDVSIMIAGKHCDTKLPQFAGQTSIEALLEVGVQIWRYQRTNMHAKLVLVDGILACIGSANLNHRSMGKDEECCGVVLSENITSQLQNRFLTDIRDADRLELRSWQARGYRTRLLERLARLLVEQL